MPTARTTRAKKPAAAKKATPKKPAAKPKPAAKQEKPKRERIVQNDVARPGPGTATGRVWEICDQLSKKAGQPAARGDVMKAGEKEDLNPATIATQYGRWRKFHGLGRYAKAD